MTPTTSPAGRAPHIPSFCSAGPVQGTIKQFDLQLFADDDDDPAPLDIGSLSDDPAQLKSVIRTILADNRTVRRQSQKRRGEIGTLQEQIAALRSDAPKALDAVKAELKSAHEADIKKAKDEHAAAVAALTTERDAVVGDRDNFKGEHETLTRSNAQLRSRFRSQFVDRHVQSELEKRITIADPKAKERAIEDALSRIDTSKIDFDEEKLDVKDPAKLMADLDAYVNDRPFLKPTVNNQQQPRFPRGTTPGRGPSDNGGAGQTSGAGQTDFSDDKRSIDDINRSILKEIGII